jgi:hypothetical protein
MIIKWQKKEYKDKCAKVDLSICRFVDLSICRFVDLSICRIVAAVALVILNTHPSAEQNMSEDLRHECGVAALYWLDEAPPGANGKVAKGGEVMDVAPMMPGMLLDLQNRGQLASGFSTYNPERAQLLDTFKDVGGVAEVFRTSHTGKNDAIMSKYGWACQYRSYALRNLRRRRCALCPALRAASRPSLEVV